MSHGLTTFQLKKLAYSFAAANQTNIPSNWKEKQEASREWLTSFLKRNTGLSIRSPEQTSQARASGFNQPAFKIFLTIYGFSLKNTTFHRIASGTRTKLGFQPC